MKNIEHDVFKRKHIMLYVLMLQDFLRLTGSRLNAPYSKRAGFGTLHSLYRDSLYRASLIRGDQAGSEADEGVGIGASTRPVISTM